MAVGLRNVKVLENTIVEIQMHNQEIMEFIRNQPRNTSRKDGIIQVGNIQLEIILQIFSIFENNITIEAEYLNELKRSFANIPTTSTNLLLKEINTYSKDLAELKNMLDVTSNKLNNISRIVAWVNLLISLLSLIKNADTILNHEFSNYFTNQAFDTHPVLGLLSQLFWNCASQTIYFRLLSVIGQNISPKWFLRKLLKISKKFKETSEEITSFFDKSKEMNEEVKLFFGEWDDKIVELVENSLSNYSGGKTFTILYLTALIAHPSMLQRFDFLTKIFAFSTSTLGETWYRRNLAQDLFPEIAIKTGNIDIIDVTELSKSSSLMDFAMLPESAINILGSSTKTTIKDQIEVETKSISPFVYSALDCISIYFSFIELTQGVNNKKSALIRNLASSAELRLKQIERFSRRYASRRLGVER